MTPLFTYDPDHFYRVFIAKLDDDVGMMINFSTVLIEFENKRTIVSLFVGRRVDIWLVDELRYGQSFNLGGLEVAFDPEANMLWIKNNDLLTRL